MKLAKRDLAAEAAKHFQGTVEQRVLEAMRLGRAALDLFLARAPAGTSRAQARAILQRNTHRGRRASRVMEEQRG